MHLKPAIFFDRDGTANVWPRLPSDDPRSGTPADYVNTWEDFEFVPDAEKAFRLLAPTQYEIIFISNQGGIGGGFTTTDHVVEIFQRMGERVGRWADSEVASYFCPHAADLGCACRKPKPFMIGMAAIELDIDLSRSWMVGDQHVDMTAAWNAGIRQLLRICDERSPPWLQFNVAGGYPVPTLLEAVTLAIRHGR